MTPMTLFPVVQPVAEVSHEIPGEERVSRLSMIAREALRLSAERSGIALGELLKDEDDVPLPFDDNYWSVSHKPKCVAAVVSKGKIGIDIMDMQAYDALIKAGNSFETIQSLKNKSSVLLIKKYSPDNLVSFWNNVENVSDENQLSTEAKIRSIETRISVASTRLDAKICTST